MKYFKEVLFGINTIGIFIIIILIFNNYNSSFEESDNTSNYESLIINKSNNDISNNSTLNKINVEVKGYVKSPGVYTFNDGQIVNDLISKAGGFTENAYTDNINLSKKLKDEMVIFVYSIYEYENLKNNKNDKDLVSCTTINYDVSACTNTGKSIIETKNNLSVISEGISDNELNDNQIIDESSNNLININTSNATELTSLNGIGVAKANNIITYRDEHGLFANIEDIKNVSGISESIYEKIKDYITVE